MVEGRERKASGLVKRGYSDNEVAAIYNLARIFLESGDIRRAQVIFKGLNIIAPNFAPAFLGTCAVCVSNADYDEALRAARKAHQLDLTLVESELFLTTCLLTAKDYNTAGTLLGGIAEKVENKEVADPQIIRFFNAQLARYRSTSKS